MTKFWLYTAWVLLALLILVYSYGFLDFNLTIFSHPFFLEKVGRLQRLVYFDRPQSALLFVVIVAYSFGLYLLTLWTASRRQLAVFPWRPLAVLLFFLTLAYPMLSYDIFNYMFHAKILWLYHANPLTHAPLEYQGDLWLRFMRWVHTPSAYGPVFVAVESPAYLLGLGKFVPVFYLMKLSMTLFFLWCIQLVGELGRILKLPTPRIVLAQLLLALNPFLLLELVVNSHNDAVMLAFYLTALLLHAKRRVLHAWVAAMLSVGIKYVTAITTPLLLLPRSLSLRLWFTWSLLLLPVLISPGRFQPWYLVWSLIPAVLLESPGVRIWYLHASLAGLLYYHPFIRTGFWLNSLPFVSLILYLPLLGLLVPLIWRRSARS